MHKIYRFEHHDNLAPNTEGKIGEGCYRDGSILHRMYAKHKIGDSHPSLSQDLVLDDDYDGMSGFDSKMEKFFCACPTLPLLRKWFYGFIMELRSYGYVIVEYEVSSFEMGWSGKQCFFTPDSVISRKVI